MQVIYGEEHVSKFKDKYVLLELDTFNVAGKLVPAFAVISASSISLGDLPQIEHWKQFHAKMMNGYKTKQWAFVIDCVANLRGKWGGEIDSFYDEMKNRVESIQEQGIDSTWTPEIIQK